MILPRPSHRAQYRTAGRRVLLLFPGRWERDILPGSAGGFGGLSFVFVSFNCICNYGEVWQWMKGRKDTVSQVRSGVCMVVKRTSREASAYVTNNSLSMRTASAACFSSRRCERVRASFSKAVSGSVVPFGLARLYDVVRGFWARLLNLPFGGY